MKKLLVWGLVMEISWGLVLGICGGLACAPKAPPMEKGISYFKEGRYEDAREIFAKNVRANRNNERAYAYLAGSLHYLKQDDDAIKYLAKLHKINPDSMPVYDLLREIYANRWETLIKEQKNILAKNEKEHTALAWTAYAYLLQKDYPAAGKQYRLLNHSYPEDTLGRIFGSWAKYKGGQKGAFEKELQQIADDQPNYYGTYFNLAGYYSENGNVEKAIANVQKAIQLEKNYGGNYNLFGLILHRQMKLQEAETQLRKAVDVDPLFTEAYLRLGNVLAALEKNQDAILFYQKVIKRQPANYTTYFLLGNAYLAQGQAAEAIPQYKKADSLKPGQAVLNFYLGSAYLMKNDKSEAAKYFEKASTVEPNSIYAQRAREELGKLE